MPRHYTRHWISNDNQILSLPLRSSQSGEVKKHVTKELWNDVINANLVKKQIIGVLGRGTDSQTLQVGRKSSGTQPE